ncbi:MAG: pyridoxal phosphate-dependent aminotransferase [Candidatus Dadabacteria bacterium]|jgi:aspartate/methionine/tyrosine aminotransferase|nr:pyridoxal phosphate-dependent aminotransferase [Candidatus Dadabacteria bacterium]MCZ6528177.1 pyridoxal phosphate-dependent aminotransferase [Candidatus Dadabacteria bacterium]MCZ6554801.1 pyridoxal phosphate-dependent aminotransferase [Candidatus Dadabacteria bacterium]MCZ6639499.1 pyridoxal phosphate-dependent aminotransferase [Candidatus Dadabacteria bacterium]MCZ6865570.1 pyridoxal phosphate-dependent aminotransferase [Candidatus Dadabacteria bacterium]
MPSKLSEEISPFYVMDVLERAKEIEAKGESVIHFEVGEPDFPTPDVISEEAIRAIKEGDTKYTHSLGILELREAISRTYESNYAIEIPPGRVIVTMGSSPALYLAIISLIEPGEEVLITDPHYACYPQIIKIAGGVPKTFRIYEEEDFQIDIGRLKKAISPRTKAILINSPANPTGVVLRPEVMREISELGIFVVSDEIYHGLVYGGEARTVYEFTETAFAVNGFSKFYSMTGWRLGYLIAPQEFIRPIQKLQQNLFISPNPFVQRAGVKALKQAGSEALKMRELFDERRKTMIEGLKGLGFKMRSEPEGAFYVFIDASDLNPNSHELAFDILEKARVAITPGVDFGEGGEGYLRLSYATSIPNIKEGIMRLGEYIHSKGVSL